MKMQILITNKELKIVKDKGSKIVVEHSYAKYLIKHNYERHYGQSDEKLSMNYTFKKTWLKKGKEKNNEDANVNKA